MTRVKLSIYWRCFLFFVSKRGTRRGTRRISIHPNFIQRFSTTASGSQALTPGPSGLRVPSDSRPRSGTNYAETVASSRTEVQTEHASADQVSPQEDSVSQIQGHSPRNGEPTRRKDVIRRENLVPSIELRAVFETPYFQFWSFCITLWGSKTKGNYIFLMTPNISNITNLLVLVL